MVDIRSVIGSDLVLCFHWVEGRGRWESERLTDDRMNKVVFVPGKRYEHAAMPSQKGRQCFYCLVRKFIYKDPRRGFYVAAVEIKGPA